MRVDTGTGELLDYIADGQFEALQILDDCMEELEDRLFVTDWTESVRDLDSSILETNLALQGNRMNTISEKATGWAAIIAVPTFITGFFGMNLPYPRLRRESRARRFNRHH